MNKFYLLLAKTTSMVIMHNAPRVSAHPKEICRTRIAMIKALKGSKAAKAPVSEAGI